MAFNSIYTGTQIETMLAKTNSLPISVVTSSSNGLMTAADKSRLDSLVLFFTNKTIATSGWVSDSTYEDYPYKANIACSGVTANYYPEVVFSLTDATSGYFAPIAESYAGGVRIWASDIPEGTVTIPTIKCTKAG